MSTFSTEKCVVDGAPMVHVAQSQSKFKLPSRLVIMWEMEMREMISEKKIHVSGEVRLADPTSSPPRCISEESGIEWNGDAYHVGKTNTDTARVRGKRWKERGGREKGESVKRSNKDNRSRRNKEHERQRGGNKGRKMDDSRNGDERWRARERVTVTSKVGKKQRY